jgi:propane monooxygenase reductase component
VGQKHSVRLQPVGIDIEVDEDESVLHGAFRQGIMLMHGCKEGQCSACKSFLLDGEIDMDSYSTFALPDFEKDEGWVLLCRTHAYSDIEVELFNYDEEVLRSGIPIETRSGVVEAVENLTHDICRLVVKIDEPLPYKAGQYVDLSVPGEDFHRSFSMSNPPSGDGRLEFMIKMYPGGRFSGLLETKTLGPGDPIDVEGPYGLFTLRTSSDRPLLFIGGGAGMSAIAALLASMAKDGSQRPASFYYGARTEADLFHREELEALTEQLPDFRFVPALSESDPATAWHGETGFVTDVCDRLEADLTEVDVYVCGPPPMVDAAIALLERRGVPEERIHFDKFTITAEAEGEGSRT